MPPPPRIPFLHQHQHQLSSLIQPSSSSTTSINQPSYLPFHHLILNNIPQKMPPLPRIPFLHQHQHQLSSLIQPSSSSTTSINQPSYLPFHHLNNIFQKIPH
ncbi:hypothetical protein PoB_001187400 [Plakobranchus ocellatus]|uniref:Uncharacterized protein n=1 Tax=Plakobranchus ocellatus TaxID=259542 RepID=A0AAV3YTJ1_9GAST|nr:hypothetical protein PoB_001187400 [Plakobranchus ocellatus]